MLGRMFLLVVSTSPEDTTFLEAVAIVELANGRGHLAHTKVLTFIFKRSFAL